MSRVIKFRAWDGINMIMPSNNSYYQHYMSFCGGIVQKSSEGMACFGGGDNWRAVDKLELMQFTGLHDVNGVEIYEGDVLKSLGLADYTFGVRQVVFNNGGFTVMGYGIIGDLCEVIGNIYEHPHLLDGGK